MGAGGSNDASGMITSINVTPLVDVVLVLLIIFMATAPLIQKKTLTVNVPKAAHAEPKATKALTLYFTAQKTVAIEDKVLSLEEIIPTLQNRLRLDPSLAVSLAADETLAYGNVIELLDAVKASGVKKVALEMRSKRKK